MSEQSKERKVRNRIIRENQLDFLEELKSKGIPLNSDQKNLLRKHRNHEELPKASRKGIQKKPGTDDSVKSLDQISADKYIDVIEEGDELAGDDFVILDHEAYDKFAQSAVFKYQGGKDISIDDWLPKDKIHHTKEFTSWVDSLLDGFQTMIAYKPFQMYCQQSDDWLAENGTETDYSDISDKKDYCFEELRRCKENTLYFMDKYLYLKEGDMSSGNMKYLSKPVHKVICFMADCGYSVMVGKGRQIAATSTYGGIALKKIVFTKNFYLKFITLDKEKGIEIFDDKIKYPLAQLPSWMRPGVLNDRDNLLRLGRKSTKKGGSKGINSKLMVVAPSKSAINGGSPQLSMVDEAGYIGILGGMMKEARPTFFWQNPDTLKMEHKRQIIIWGTGGEMDKGGHAYEEEFITCLDKWRKREFTNGIVPMFFDWTCRPGITQEFYDNELKAYSVEGPERESKMVQFRQHYPSVLEDMFLTSNKTLVGIDWINKNLEKIRKLSAKARPITGYFEPVFDYSKPSDENSDVPFKIIGANFIPTDDGDPRASASIFLHPSKNWINRYYAGTDPIMSDNGYSNMSTAIFDSHLKTISAVVDYRDSNHKYTFLQCMLLKIYYDINRTGDNKVGVKELVESNVGTAYVDYQEMKGMFNSLVYKTELPHMISGGGHEIGIDNKGNRNKFIINKLFELLISHGDNFYLPVIFEQLRTFTCTITKAGNETWGVAEKRKHHDDVLFAIVFAYICSLCYEHLEPKELTSESQKYKKDYKLTRDSNGRLTRKFVTKRLNF